VAARHVVDYDLSGGIHAFQTEFSIVSALAEIESLHELTSSKQPEMRGVVNNVLKTAAALQVVTGSHGAYAASRQVAGGAPSY
jgi:hypothetical protein